MTGAISLDELSNSSDDDSSTGTSELEQLCDELDADLDHVDEYIAQNGGRDDIVEFAKKLRDNDDLFELMEEYRAMMGPHRIHEKYLRGDSTGSYSTWSSHFYGDSDNPEDGTFNDVQQRARDGDGNLAHYKALFPEPVAEHFPGQPVCWQDFGDDVGYGDGKQDANIYVTRDFCETYDSYTIDVAGQERPRPPTDSEIGSSSGDGGGADASSSTGDHPDVWDVTSDAARDFAQSLSPEEAADALEREKSNPQFDGGRKTVKEPLRKRANESGNEDSSSADSGGSDSSPAATAGDINKMGDEGHDISPEKVVELQESGWSKEEIIEFYG